MGCDTFACLWRQNKHQKVSAIISRLGPGPLHRGAHSAAYHNDLKHICITSALYITSAYSYNCCCPAFPCRKKNNKVPQPSSSNLVVCWDAFLVPADTAAWLQACEHYLAFPSKPSGQAAVDLLWQAGHPAMGAGEILPTAISAPSRTQPLQHAARGGEKPHPLLPVYMSPRHDGLGFLAVTTLPHASNHNSLYPTPGAAAALPIEIWPRMRKSPLL